MADEKQNPPQAQAGEVKPQQAQAPEAKKPQAAPAQKPAQAAGATQTKPTQKISGLELVRFRNFFYRDGYRKTMSALLISLSLNIILIVLSIVLMLSSTPPVYFATQTDGSLVEIQPLDKPLVNEDMLLTWATRAAVSAYSFNFLDWQNDLQNVQQYFTSTGFQNFVEALQNSGNLDTVVAKRLVVQATVVDVPRIVQQGLIKGRYAWKIQIPMLVKYISANEELKQPILVTLLVARVPTTQKAQGIAIAQFVVEDRRDRL